MGVHLAVHKNFFDSSCGCAAHILHGKQPPMLMPVTGKYNMEERFFNGNIRGATVKAADQ